MTTHREYDSANRLRRIESRTNGVAVCSFTYDYNLAGQRTRVTTAPEASHWDYTYDALGQVTSGLKRWSDSTLVAGAQFNYGFDTIGNRLWTEAGGDAAGNGLRHASYTNNLLNQITARDVPGAADVTGSAHPQVAVTVNGSTANRHSDYYHQVLTWNNATGAVWAAITNRAQCQGLSDTSTGHLLLPRTPEAFLYDQDGNLTQDGLWNYTWDAENRLTRMVSRSATPSDSWQWLEFRYDWQGRRISKTVSNWVTGHWSLVTDHRFVYDGWNLIAVLSSDLSPLTSFTWGTDLSGSMQGAGGVGGLLWLTDRSAPTTRHFACYDGNGNLKALVNATDNSVSASYDYGPFGELLRSTGPKARANPLRFSTKCQDDESDLVYYGHRYLNAATGRWLSRDPVGEAGARNLQSFANNNPSRFLDPDGGMPLLAVERSPHDRDLSELFSPVYPDPRLFAEAPSTPGKTPPTPGKTVCKSGMKHCPNNAVTSNGRGTEGWKGKLVPEMPFWMINFHEPCNAHDICYGTCGNEKTNCDNEFLADMVVACNMKFGWSSISPMPLDLRAKLTVCNSLASTYYTAVSAAGESAYKAGQEKGCRCCCETKKK